MRKWIFVLIGFCTMACDVTATSQANREVKVPSDWAEYKFNNSSFSIKVPPTVELRGDADPFSQNLKSISPQIINNSNRVAFQQKGLAFKDPEASKRYARILLLCYTESYGDFPMPNERTDFLLSKQDVDDIIEGELEGLPKTTRVYNISYGNEIVNGNQAFVIHYTRTGAFGNPPVKCKICLLFNNRHFTKLMYSYRETEAEIWASDFEKSLRTFRWLE